MKRVTTFKGIFAVIAILFAIGIYSCQKAVNPVDNTADSANLSEYDAAEMYVMTDYDPGIEFTDATLEQPAMLNGDKQMNRYRMQHGFFFGRVFLRMKLTKDQLASLREYMIAYHQCVRDTYEGTRQDRIDLMKRANQARMEVLTKLRAGEIDRIEARRQIMQINIKLREALANLIDWDARCECLRTLIDNITNGLGLTDEQMTIWKDFLSKFTADNPCFG